VKRRLWFLNIVLLALLALIFVRFQQVRQHLRDRTARNLNHVVKPVPVQALPPIGAPAPAVAANYADVAIKMLFSRDRNPTVILDPVAPPPVKPMPPLPVAYGAMFFGEPGIILALPNAKATQRLYRKGEAIGDFKLVNFDNTNIAFEWDGKVVERRLDQVMAKPSEVPAEPAAASAPPAPTSTVASTTNASGPGATRIDGTRACVPGDKTASGTIVDGFRKHEVRGPIATFCQWEQVK
jgi:hypothetical protein